MSEIGQRIANLSPAQRALLEKRLNHAVVRASEPIAIVGAACRVPGGVDDLAAFWSLLRGGVDAITLVPSARWDADSLFDQDPSAAGKISSRWGGFISDADRFDASFFGISPREAMEMDPQQRILLEVACDALDHAGLTREELAGSRMGIFVGVHGHASDYLLLQNRDLNKLDSFSGTGVAHNLLAGRLSYFLDSHGPAIVIDTACSSSLVALHLAVQSIRLGESSSALVGGVNLILTPNFTVAASRMHMLAPDGRCKAFDHRADGFVRSEGCGVVVLKLLSEAVACGDSILAVVRGSAINQDGHTNGITAPNGLAQRQVIERALSDAGVAADQIGFVEAHGTGTALGDPIEIEALSATIGAGKESAGRCFVGSVKTNIGHLEGAAGIVGLIKASLVLHHGEIPPNLHFTSLNPHIRLAGTRLEFPKSLEKWDRSNAPRRASVSSFGWSGTNAHVILEEAPLGDPRSGPTSHDVRLLPISAHSPEALVGAAKRMRDRLCADPPIKVDDLSFTAAVRRSHHPCRMAVVGRSIADFGQGIDAALNGRSLAVGAAIPPRIAFVFPGHGAQWSGMGQALLQTEPVFRDAMERCDAAIRTEAGWSLLELIQSADSSLIDEARIAQPALFAFGVALSQLWKSWGVTPAAVIGHSMGEVAACHVAGALSLADATRIICRRSALLQKVADRGGMLLVELSREEAQREIAGLEGQLSVGAVNGPRSTVLAGDHSALEKISAALVARNVFCRIVKGSPPGHSHLVQPLTPSLLADIATIKASAAQIPIYSTVTAEVQNGESFDAAYWGRNFCEPVRLFDAVQALLRDGFDTLIEISPHPILSAVLRDIASEAIIDADKTNPELREAIVLPSLRREDNDQEILYDTLGKLYERGTSVRWAQVAPKSGKMISLPGYAWQRQRYWLERPPASFENHAGLGQPSGHLHDDNEDRPDVGEWLYRAEWAEAKQWPQSRSPSGDWIVLADGAESADLAAALDANLRAAGGGTQIISGDVGVAAALELARTGARRWKGIVHCAALDATPNAAITQASLSANPVPGAQSLLDAVRALDANEWGGEPKLWIVTRGATSVHAKDRTDLAIAQAAMTGLARVVQAEHPTRLGAWVDVDPAATLDEQAAQLAAELLHGGDEPALALRDSRRYVQRLLPLVEPTVGRASEFRSDSSYLITGGLGGIGRFVARWLITKGARHLLIVGRTPIPPRSEWRVAGDVAGSQMDARVAAVLELESLGASIYYEAVDVGDADAMSQMLTRWHNEARPRIRGIIHAAAVIDDQLLTELQPRSIDQVFRAKAVGAWVLHSLLPNADWMVLFSSLASIWPAPGHANYAAANAFLDALAYYRNGSGRHGLSVSWGLWTDIGFAATPGGREAQRRFAEQGVNGFAPADALRALDVLLACSVPHAAVLNADRDMLANRHIDGHVWPLLRGFSVSRGEAPIGARQEFLALLQGSEPGGRLALLQQRIKKHVEELLKLESVRLDIHRPLGEYGLNSIMGLELRHRLERDIALRLPATLAWNYPTIAAMAEHLLSRVYVEGSAGAARGADDSVHDRNNIVATGDLGARITQIGALSDEDALAALRANKRGDSR